MEPTKRFAGTRARGLQPQGTRYYGDFGELNWRDFWSVNPAADCTWQRPRAQEPLTNLEIEENDALRRCVATGLADIPVADARALPRLEPLGKP